ncbi:MAG TPA: histidine phosphatase family protein [Candidatus Methylomirabilis sp.]|nr:histidine phosphatase family protein [Candidatus Methylomirabilis sp.]
MRMLLLARHGQSVANAVRRFQGSQDVALSDLGRRQAAALGAALRPGRLSHVYASPLVRARLTAEAVVAELGVPLTLVDDLRELSLGEWEGCTVDEIRAQPGDPYARWVRDPVRHVPPGGEPLADVQERALRAIDAIAGRHPDGDRVLVVSHGGVISACLAHWLGLPLSSIWRLTVGNGSVSRVSPPRVLSVNETAHLSSVDGSGGGPGLSP